MTVPTHAHWDLKPHWGKGGLLAGAFSTQCTATFAAVVLEREAEGRAGGMEKERVREGKEGEDDEEGGEGKDEKEGGGRERRGQEVNEITRGDTRWVVFQQAHQRPCTITLHVVADGPCLQC